MWGNRRMKKKKKKIHIILACIASFLLLQWLFIGYRYNFGPFKRLGDIRMAKIPGNSNSYGMDLIKPMEDSPLEGKEILFLGSSVTYGAASLREGIPEYFAIRLNAKVTKEAVSGTTLTDDSNSSYVHRLLTKVDSSKDYDLVVVQLSTNDASKDKTLGEISESMNIEDFNTKTVTGAMEYIIAYVKENWDCPFMLFIGSKYDSPEYELMVERAKELREKWGIGLSNLWDNEEVNSISDELRSEYIAEDGIHPTMEGYQNWWGPYMEEAVLDYLESQE